MKNFNLFILVSIVVLIQLSALGSFLSPARMPNLALALVISLVIFQGFERYLGWVIFSGFLLDAGTGWPMGSTPLLLVLIALGIDKLNSVANIRSGQSLFLLSLAVILVLSLFIFDWASIGLSSIEKHFLNNSQLTYSPVKIDFDYLMKSAYTVLSGFLIYFILKKLQTNDFPKIFQQKASS
jgi:cell shape-determining protein MreD